MFAKYINTTTIEPAPRNKDQWSNYDQNETLLLADGYLPVVVVEAPTAEKPLVKYRETGEQIEQYAEELPIEQCKQEVRAVRDRMINAFEWRISRNNDERELVLTETDNRELLLNYRQYLRDYTETENWYESSPLPFSEWNELTGISGELDTLEEITNV